MIFLMNYTELILIFSPKTSCFTPSIIEELGNVNVDMLIDGIKDRVSEIIAYEKSRQPCKGYKKGKRGKLTTLRKSCY